jgi:hypothetical protein
VVPVVRDQPRKRRPKSSPAPLSPAQRDSGHATAGSTPRRDRHLSRRSQATDGLSVAPAGGAQPAGGLVAGAPAAVARQPAEFAQAGFDFVNFMLVGDPWRQAPGARCRAARPGVDQAGAVGPPRARPATIRTAHLTQPAKRSRRLRERARRAVATSSRPARTSAAAWNSAYVQATSCSVGRSSRKAPSRLPRSIQAEHRDHHRLVELLVAVMGHMLPAAIPANRSSTCQAAATSRSSGRTSRT